MTVPFFIGVVLVQKFSRAEEKVLRDLVNGCTLKLHRHFDGGKTCRLHPLNSAPEAVERATVDRLKRRGLIDSNKKFPAATYLLTDKGRLVAEKLVGSPVNSLSAKNY